MNINSSSSSTKPTPSTALGTQFTVRREPHLTEHSGQGRRSCRIRQGAILTLREWQKAGSTHLAILTGGGGALELTVTEKDLLKSSAFEVYSPKPTPEVKQ